MIENTTLGFIGGGHMAAGIIEGIVTSLLPGSQIIVHDPQPTRRQHLQQRYCLQWARNNQQVVNESDVVILCVKPQILGKVLKPLAPAFAQNSKVVISIAAGVNTNTLQQWLSDTVPIVRVMPNMPAVINHGASGLYANTNVNSVQRELVYSIISTIGTAIWVESDDEIDIVTALSGSGPAYFMLFIKALADAANQAGLDYTKALQLAIATAAGTAKMIAGTHYSLDELIEQVSSPGGTTEQAIQSFTANKLSDIITEAFTAARIRAQQIAYSNL